MLDLDPQTDDRYSYPQCPPEDRWIYNKLTVAEKLGYNCGPSGTDITKQGTYVLRPIMNFLGYGWGYFKFEAQDFGQGIEQPDYMPGYFWCQWFDGWHEWTEFTDDQVVDWSGGLTDDRGFMENSKPVVPAFQEVPDLFKGISRHMLIESIGGNIIEVSPRHIQWGGPKHATDVQRETTTPFTGEVTEDMGYRWRPIART